MIYSGVFSISALFVGLLNSIIIARISSPEILGAQVLWIAMAGWSVSIGQFGFRSWIIREVANNQLSLNNLIKIAALTSIAAFTIAPLFYLIVHNRIGILISQPPNLVFVLFGGYAAFKAIAANFASANRGLGRIGPAEFTENLFGKLLLASYLLLLFFTETKLDIFNLFIVMTCASIATAVVNVWPIIYQKRNLAPMSDQKLPSFSDVFPFWGISLSNLFAQRIDIMILGMFSSAETIGFYQIANSLASALGTAHESAKKSVLNVLPRWTTDPQSRRAIRLQIKQVVKLSSIFTAVGFFMMVVAGEKILSTIWGAAYESAFPILIVLCMSMLINTVAGPVGMASTLNRLEKMTNLCFWSAAIGNAALSLLLVQHLDGVGVAVGSLVSNLIFNISLFLVLWKKIRMNLTAFG